MLAQHFALSLYNLADIEALTDAGFLFYTARSKCSIEFSNQWLVGRLDAPVELAVHAAPEIWECTGDADTTRDNDESIDLEELVDALRGVWALEKGGESRVCFEVLSDTFAFADVEGDAGGVDDDVGAAGGRGCRRGRVRALDLL